MWESMPATEARPCDECQESCTDGRSGTGEGFLDLWYCGSCWKAWDDGGCLKYERRLRQIRKPRPTQRGASDIQFPAQHGASGPCPTPGCRFLAHTSPAVEGYCCWVCHRSHGSSHGPHCEQWEATASVSQGATGYHTEERESLALQRGNSSSSRAVVEAMASEMSAVAEAVWKGDLRKLMRLLRRDGCDPNGDVIVGPNGNVMSGTSLLMQAAMNGSNDIVAVLLLRKADPSLTYNGQTAETRTGQPLVKALLQLFREGSKAPDQIASRALQGLSIYICQEVAAHLGISDVDALLSIPHDEEPAALVQASLVQAIQAGDLLATLAALQAGADVNVRDAVGETPLFEAVASDDDTGNLVAALLIHKADPFITTAFGQTAHGMACTGAAKTLLECFMDPTTDKHSKKAAVCGLHHQVREQVAEWLEVNLSDADIGETLLLQAVRANNLQRVEALLKNGESANVRDAVGETPLFEAAASGDVDMVATLLLGGADPCVVSPSNITVEDMADATGVSVLLQLFKHQLDVGDASVKKALSGLSKNLRSQVYDNASSVCEHVRTHTPAREDPGDDLDDALLAAVRSGDVHRIAELLQCGADPNSRDEVGETPLFEAVAGGDSNVVAALLLRGADQSLTSSSGDTAREIADREDIAALLRLFQGVAAPADEAIAFGGLRDDVQQHVVDHLRVSLSTSAAASLAEQLMNEVMCEEGQGVARLLKQGADPNTRNLIGEPLLFEAAASSSADIVALLLVHRADAALKTSSGQVALDIAKIANDKEVITLLQLFDGIRVPPEVRATAIAALNENVRSSVDHALRDLLFLRMRAQPNSKVHDLVTRDLVKAPLTPQGVAQNHPASKMGGMKQRFPAYNSPMLRSEV